MRDETIVAAIKNNSEEAMSSVINKYSRLLWPIAAAVLKNTGSEQDVEECVADTFIYLWEYPEKFDPGRGSLKTLLCIIVRTKAIDRYRKINRQHTVPLDEVIFAVTAGLQEAYLEKETRQQLFDAVCALEEPNREILIRRYYHSQKPREIALAMGMTVKQIGNSLYRSKNHLHQIIAGKDGVR